MRKLYLVAYDISAKDRLRNALQASRSFAIGGQKSVHECTLSEAERDELQETMKDLLDLEEDRLLLLRLDPRAVSFTLGRAVRPQVSTVFYVG